MMKKLFIVMMLMMPMMGIQAQTADDELMKEIKRSIELQDMVQTFSKTMTLQLQPLVAQGTLPSDKLPVVVKEIEEVVVPLMMERYIAFYKEHFTLEELKQANAYLASPVGQKFVKLAPMLATEGMSVTTKPEVQAEIQKIMMRNIQQ